MNDGRASDRVLAAIDDLRDELVEAVSSAVRIQSVNPRFASVPYMDAIGGEGDVSRFVAEVYREAGCEVDVFAVTPGRENAVGRLSGTDRGRSLIFNGHIDTMPPGDPARWTGGDPFSGRIEEGRIWGRGSTDMKAGVLAQAYAAVALRRAGIALAGDLILESVVGEESMEPELGTTAVVERGYVADAAVVSEPGGPRVPLAISPASCGQLWLGVTVRGLPTHGANRHEIIRPGGLGRAVGVNAVDKGLDMLLALRELEERWNETKRHPLFPVGQFTIDPETIVTTVAGSEVDTMTFDVFCFYPPGDTAESLRAEIEEFLGCRAAADPWLRDHPPELVVRSNWPPCEISADHPICVSMGRAHERAATGSALAGPAQLRGFAAVEDTSFLNAAGIPALSYGPGNLGVAHAYDEYVSIDELIIACRAYALLALDWCGQAPPR